MRSILYILGILILLGTSCKTKSAAYVVDYADGGSESVKTKTVKSKKRCFKLSKSIVKDKSLYVISKSIIKYDCLGLEPKIISCKKWALENGKLKRQKDNCKPSKF